MLDVDLVCENLRRSHSVDRSSPISIHCHLLPHHVDVSRLLELLCTSLSDILVTLSRFHLSYFSADSLPVRPNDIERVRIFPVPLNTVNGLSE